MPFRPDPPPAAPVPTQARGRFVPDAPAPAKPRPLDADGDGMQDLPSLPGEPSMQSAPLATPKPSYLGGIAAAAQKAQQARIGQPSIFGITAGDAESAISLGTSLIAPFLASARGLIGGYEPTNREIEDVTFQPRSEVGQANNELLGAALAPISESGADVALTGLVPDVPAAVPKGPRVPKVRETPPAPDFTNPKTAARGAGFKLLPSEAGGGKIAQAAESLMGTAGKKDFQRANQKTATQLAQREIGADSLDPQGIQKVRDEGDAAYTAMEGIGQVTADQPVVEAIAGIQPRTGMRTNKDIAELQAHFEGLLGQPWDAANVVQEVRQLRKEANANSAPPAMGAKPDPKKQSLAQAQIRIANALDDWLERNAQTVGQPEVAKNYRAARQRLAKTASVERATSGGKVDVRNLEKQDERGVPHTGRLKIASQTSEYFPESTGAAVGSEVNITPDTLFGTVRNAAQNILLRPIISRILRSDMYQNRLGRETIVSPEGPLGSYFAPEPPSRPYVPFADAAEPPLPRTSAESMRVANQRAGDLELVPEGESVELPEAPSRLQAETPPAPSGDLPFTASQPGLADELAAGLDFAPEQTTGRLPGGRAPRAAGMAERVEGTSVYPELRAVRGTSETGQALDELSLADEFSRPLAIEGQPEITNLDDVLRLVDDEPPPEPPKGGPPKGTPPTGGGERKAVTAAEELGLEELLQAMIRENREAGGPPPLPRVAGERPPVTESVQDFIARQKQTGNPDAFEKGRSLGKKIIAAREAKKANPTIKYSSKGDEHVVESDAGAVKMRKVGDQLRVNYSRVKDSERRKGQGIALYIRAIEEAERQGLTLASDHRVSTQAQRVYEALKRRGYRVTESPGTVRDEGSGELVSSGELKPVYVVRSPAKPEARSGTR